MATVIHEPSFGEGLGAGFSQGLDQFMMMKQWNKFLDAYQARQQGGQPQTGRPFNNPMAVYGEPGQTPTMGGGMGGGQQQNPMLQGLMKMLGGMGRGLGGVGQGIGAGFQGLGAGMGAMGRGLGGMLGLNGPQPAGGAPMGMMPPVNRQGAPGGQAGMAGAMGPMAGMAGMAGMNPMAGAAGMAGMNPMLMMLLQRFLGNQRR